MDKRKAGGSVIQKIMKRGQMQDLPEEQETNEGLHAACEEILAAVEAKDASALMSALQSAFEIMEEMPHEEAGMPE